MMQSDALNSQTESDPGQGQFGSDSSGGVCVPNISDAERRKRLMGGIIGFVFSLGVLAVLMATGADRAWRVLMLPLFWGATTGFFQWRDKT
jgi:hypothetical protein